MIRHRHQAPQPPAGAPPACDRRTLLVGWKKDPFDKRDKIRPVRLEAMPEKVDLLELMPAVRDQNKVGCCFGFSAAENLYGQARIDKSEPVEIFSPTWIYNGARFLEGTLGQDVGCYPRSGLEWLRMKGALPERLWPYNGAKLDPRTPASELEPEAARWPIISYSRVIGGAAGIASALAEGKPVSIGTPWYDEWCYPGPDGLLPKITTASRPAGGHATIVYGYDMTTETLRIHGEGLFLCQNSWGETYGAGGRFLLPMSAFKVFTQQGGYDAYTIDVDWTGPRPEPGPMPPKPLDDPAPSLISKITLGVAIACLLVLVVTLVLGR